MTEKTLYMRRNLKNLKLIFMMCLLVLGAQAQKIGNGGNFDTDQARVIIDKVALVLKNNLFQGWTPFNSEWIASLENTKEVFNLQGQEYSSLDQYIVVTRSLKMNANKHTICIIGTTESLGAILSQESTGELIKKVSQKLVVLESLEAEERNKVISNLKSGMEFKFIPTYCVLE